MTKYIDSLSEGLGFPVDAVQPPTARPEHYTHEHDIRWYPHHTAFNIRKPPRTSRLRRYEGGTANRALSMSPRQGASYDCLCVKPTIKC